MIYNLKGENYSVNISVTDSSASIDGGYFGEISLAKTPLTRILLRKLPEAKEFWVTDGFNKVRAQKYGDTLRITLSEPMGIPDLTFVVNGTADSDGISWSVKAINDNPDHSVMSVSYPLPQLTAEKFDLFVPGVCGKVVKDAGKRGYNHSGDYPKHDICMPYFAVYGETSGVYLGIEDGRGAMKHFVMTAVDNTAGIIADYPAVNMTKPHNSFALDGISRWQFIRGDWYDATMLYKKFVRTHAEWMPEIGENGREDTPEKFRDIPFWVVGYIPNSPSQGGNMPMSLGIGTAFQTENYWYESVIKLQSELGVPIALHMYNWHDIPFNIEYPHFIPPRARFLNGLKEMKKHDISVMLYINAVSWETLDGEMGHEINFENTGRHGAVIDQYGKLITCTYPQLTVKGTKSLLAPICPTFEKWHNIISDLARRLMTEYDIDGIYFDEISAHCAHSCCNPEHSHLPGGGSYWSENFRLMMEKVRSEMPVGSFSFSECNAETYIKSFDGQLTWTWVQNGEVPAFPAIYAGCTQMLGRFNLGKKQNDFEYFKYTSAKSLMYGQQLGWITTGTLEQPGWLDFLKIIVRERYRLSKVFSGSDMLRPPLIKCSLPEVVTTAAGLWVENEDIVMEQVLGGAWRSRDGKKTVVMLMNIAETDADFELSFSADEYGVESAALPYGFVMIGDRCVISGKLSPHEFRSWEWIAQG